MPADRTTKKQSPADTAALVQQKSDFTAEGAPPPNHLAKAAPQRVAAVRRAGTSPPTRKGPAGRKPYG